MTAGSTPTRPPVTRDSLSVPQPLRPEDEALRVARLRNMKAWALALLIIATVIFIVARLFEGRYPWLGIVRATAEASMVGGIADWFAVTALFKHPMGIPIPHTAIIPTRKDRVGVTLGAFVQKNFLHKDVIVAKLHTLNAAERMARVDGRAGELAAHRATAGQVARCGAPTCCATRMWSR